MRIFVAGHHGMVGSAILRQLKEKGSHELITRRSDQLDLTNQDHVRAFFQAERPDAVVLAAARVGGIHANNNQPAQFIYENLMIECNVIHQAHAADVQNLIQLGSSCIYPRKAPQPIEERALLTGPLEPTNEPYAIAKIAGIKLCESYNRQYGRNYRSVMPTNLYGPGDNFHPDNGHVLPALMLRFHHAALEGAPHVIVWGSGTPQREFLHVNDMAAATLFVMNLSQDILDRETSPMQSHINIGTGVDISIRELAELLARATGFAGEIKFDRSKPDGALRKLMDVSVLSRLGWKASIGLEEGVAQTYQWFLQHRDHLRSK